jgi:hypothetical protein
MSRSWNHKKSGYYGAKKAFREGTAEKHRAMETRLLSKIAADPESAEEVVFTDYTLCDDWWSYD